VNSVLQKPGSRSTNGIQLPARGADYWVVSGTTCPLLWTSVMDRACNHHGVAAGHVEKQ